MEGAGAAPPCRSLLNRQRIVAIHQGALGDFLLTLPAINGLHRSHAAFVIDLWTKPHHAALASGLPFVGAFHTCEGMELTPFYHEDLWERAEAPSFFRGAAFILFFGQESALPLCRRLSRRLSCPVHWIQSFPPEGKEQPVSEFLADQLRTLGWSAENAPVRLKPSPGAAAEMEDRLRRLGCEPESGPIIIHPGSGGRKKIWPLGKWNSLLQWTARHARKPVVLILGPADSHLEPFARRAAGEGIHLVRDMPPTQVLALLSRGSVYVGNDSGMSHLAAASGIETIVIFGPTNPHVWAPRGPHVRVFHTQWSEKDNLDMDRIFLDDPDVDAVRQLLASRAS